jgi:hypothetical protein
VLTLAPFWSPTVFLFPIIQYHGVMIMVIRHKTEFSGRVTVHQRLRVRTSWMGAVDVSREERGEVGGRE